LQNRTASRLLHVHKRSGHLADLQFTDCVNLLHPGDLLIFNDTRVSALRLYGQKTTGAQVEALLIHQNEPMAYQALVKPAKRLKPGTTVHFNAGLTATVEPGPDDILRTLRFHPISDFANRLDEASLAPLPPYIQATLSDRERYQTVFAKNPGSAAAPTAALHFTNQLLDQIVQKGVGIAFVTLHVGLDTFRPIQTDSISEHQMHGEVCSISEETQKAVAECKGRIIAVGTTTTRTLESFATGKRTIKTGSQISRLFITPGYDFKIVDGMFTNFHMPRTSMLLMISSLTPANFIVSAYKHAVNHRYRFLSFGDSMLILET
jgi:S-adenosylmethionine:tRNA ribosyltransferase-isomerase